MWSFQIIQLIDYQPLVTRMEFELSKKTFSLRFRIWLTFRYLQSNFYCLKKEKSLLPSHRAHWEGKILTLVTYLKITLNSIC